MTNIQNAAERSAKIKNLITCIEQVQNAWGAKPNTQKGRAIAQAAMAAHYYLNPDPVVYIAALRGDASEMNQFVLDCEKQIQDEQQQPAACS